MSAARAPVQGAADLHVTGMLTALWGNVGYLGVAIALSGGSTPRRRASLLRSRAIDSASLMAVRSAGFSAGLTLSKVTVQPPLTIRLMVKRPAIVFHALPLPMASISRR